jgi:hypothetical protein
VPRHGMAPNDSCGARRGGGGEATGGWEAFKVWFQIRKGNGEGGEVRN